MAMRTLNIQANISAMLASTHMRLQFLSRYPGQLVMDLVLPIVLAAMPIFLGREALRMLKRCSKPIRVRAITLLTF
jgi:hypothetical protein